MQRNIFLKKHVNRLYTKLRILYLSLPEDGSLSPKHAAAYELMYYF